MSVSSPLTTPGTQVGQNALQQPQMEEKTPQAACRAFEEMLVSQLFKSVRQSTPLQGKDFGHSMFQEMFDEQLSAHIADQGLGIGDTILHDFVPHVAKGPTKSVDEYRVDKRWQAPLSERGEER